MPNLGLNHYNLRAPRSMMEQLRSFYGELVGLTVGERPPFTSFGYWLYAGGQAVLHLSEAREGEERSANPENTGSTENTFDHAAFDCTDRAGFERRLTAHGVAFRVAHVPLTGQVQLFFKDPAGNGVELNFSDEAA